MIGSIGSPSTYPYPLHFHSELEIAGALSFGENFGALKGGEQHFVIQAFRKSVDLIRTFMYIPWLAKFILNFPPPKALKESRFKVLQVLVSVLHLNVSLQKRQSIGS